jgi:threonine dehydrogenase-like Zn-dependent dehydrogenase
MGNGLWGAPRETRVIAATFRGVRDVIVREKPEPRIETPSDVIVEVELAGLCGSDLHAYRGRELGIDAGTTLGHELTGRIIATGGAVERFRVGDAVVSPFTTSCGACGPCHRRLSARCEQSQLFGWIEGGHGLEGAQAPLVRVPLADATLVARPKELSPLEALLLGDVAATGFSLAQRAGVVPGATVVVIGCGAVGLSALIASRELGAERVIAVDMHAARLELARSLGAIDIDAAGPDRRLREVEEIARDVSAAAGRDAVGIVLEAVGSSDATKLAYEVLRPGGTMAIAGVHTEPSFAVSPSRAYDKNLTIIIGRTPARSVLDDLIPLQIARRLPFARLVTHRLSLADARDAYAVFDAGADGVIKIVFEPR